MSIEEIIIKIRKKGQNLEPDYNLVIYGFGKVKFDGFKNVKYMGKKEWDISDEKIIEILTEFKTTKFFALKDSYLIREDEIQPVSTISISIPDENGKILTKNVIYNQKDPSVPIELVNIEKKILELVEFERFNSKLVESNDRYKEKKEIEEKREINFKGTTIKKPVKKHLSVKAKKYFIIVCIILLILAILIIPFYFEIFDLSEENGVKNTFLDLNIVKFTTAKKIYGYNNLNINDSFEKDETFYFYIELSGIKTTDNNTKCELEIKLTLLKNNKIVDTIFLKVNELKDYYNSSITPDDSWAIGIYEVKIYIIDKFSQTSLDDTIFFNLSEKSLKIIKLLPVSYVGGYNNYVFNYSYTISDTLYIYQEYDGFTVDTYENCDIKMNIIVNVSGSTIYSESYSENNGNVKMHKWEIFIDNSWPSNVYLVNVTIEDNLSGLITSKSTSFRVL